MLSLRICRVLRSLGVSTLALVACNDNQQTNPPDPSGSVINAASVGNTATASPTVDRRTLAREPGRVRGTYEQRATKRFSELDLDKDGKVTKAEVEAVHEARFAGIDSNGDGVLDSAELTAFHDAKRAEHAQERFDRFDEDGDGKLSVSEAPRFLLERFEVVDADGDGVVTAKEMAAAEAQRSTRPKGGQGPHVLAMDLNEDGKITAADFKIQQAAWFAQADSNGDGVLTPEEVRVGRSGQGGAGRRW
jgi:Ca2+-binding EF-hand superfamily protein